MVKAIHAAGKPAILHSCGQLEGVMDDIIDDIGFDAKHSYEDTILPVEQAYDRYGSRIAILGGIDVDFICRSTPDAVFERARRLLDKTGCKGYALGSGNSIPYYVPDEGWAAMVCAALED
jgi:uroporphyrinogen decarboxylase